MDITSIQQNLVMDITKIQQNAVMDITNNQQKCSLVESHHYEPMNGRQFLA